MYLPREAAKMFFFLVVGPLKGGNGKDRTTKKKSLKKKMTTKINSKVVDPDGVDLYPDLGPREENLFRIR